MNKFLLPLIFLCFSCSSDGNIEEYTPTPYQLQIPEIFENTIINPVIPQENPLTEEGVRLGKKLFFEKLLSKDNSIACASCHSPRNAFTDNNKFSTGVDNSTGNRNSMPLFNLAWNYDERFAWDGKEFSLERQALEPVNNPHEMNSTWSEVISKLQNHAEYPALFEEAFGKNKLTKESITKAIAQFERTLISADSKFDKYLLGTETLSQEELNGFSVFISEDKGDCFHCHGGKNNPLWTDNEFRNNGLDEFFSDLGLGDVTGDPNDNGKFRTPSLRNLVFTSPYMHDGRFETIEEVIDFYSEGLKKSPTIDPLMKNSNKGGANLSTQDKSDLKAFLLTLTDNNFVNNPDFRE